MRIFPKKSCLILAGFLVLSIILSCKNDGSNESAGSATGNLSMQLAWPDETSSSNKQTSDTPAFATLPALVTTIRAIVSGADMADIQRDFDASLGTGEIDNIPAGKRCIIVQGLDSSGAIRYQGECPGIMITAGQTTDAGTITMTEYDAKEISTFGFTAATNPDLSADVTAAISGTGITATVPYGTDVTALVATYTTTGSSVSVGGTAQTSGTTVNDFSSSVTYTVTAADASTQDYTVTVTAGVAGDSVNYTTGSVSFTMVYVPGGLTFPTGTGDSGTATVTNAYQIGQTEVTYELWNAVHTWATDAARGANQYTFAHAGVQGDSGGGTNQHPVTTVNWRDSMVWMNALTEYHNAQNGTSLTCVYYSDANYVTPIRTATDSTTTTEGTPGTQDNPYIKSGSTGNTDMANSTATGFRLLTSNEWELAARYINDANSDGDIQDANEYYPGSYASGATADYTDFNATNAVAWFGNSMISGTGNTTSTQPVSQKVANALGLYDMSGNVYEWTFDIISGSNRVSRGGSWYGFAFLTRVGLVYYFNPFSEFIYIGFRFARTP